MVTGTTPTEDPVAELSLRDYQVDALAAVRDAWASGIQRPAVVAPTGSGKTVMFAHLISEHTARGGSDYRALVLVHRDELADQAIDKIRQVAPGLHVGKVKADVNETEADVVVASVQTLARPSRLALMLSRQEVHGWFGLVVVDEAHHAVAPSWREVLTSLGAFERARLVNVVGFSATLARGDGVGLGSVWQKVVYAVSLTRLIRRGYLADVRGVQVTVDDLDLSDVRQTGGDYQVGALGTALTESMASRTVAKAYREHAGDRPGVVFAPTVAAAEELTEELHAAGIPSAMVTGTTPTEDRKRIYSEYQAGRTQVLVNCMVLTEGWDAPWASCAVIARPTRSAPLYQQMVGRVLRPYPGKTDALVLDVVGASGLHKLATLIDLEPGAVRSMTPAQSFLDAVEEQEAADGVELDRKTLGGALHAEQVELFEQSTSMWLQTEAGVWFIPVTDGDWMLWPSTVAGHWDACYAPKAEELWRRVHTGLSLELAMSWTQVEAEEQDATVASRGSAWRKSGKASEPQARYLVSITELSYEDAKALTKNEASNLISIKLASKRFDRRFRKEMMK